MAGIFYDARRIKAYEGLLELGAAANESAEWCNALWLEIIADPGLMEEFVFYLDNHYLTDNIKCEGYSMTDLYVWQLNRYNLIGDWGKNTGECNKDRMVLKAFYDMAQMRKNPEEYMKRFALGKGMDMD